MRVVCNMAKKCDRAGVCGGARPHNVQGCEKCPVNEDAECREISERDEILNALKVLIWSGATRKWLREHDPMALAQGEQAILRTGDRPACGWDRLG